MLPTYLFSKCYFGIICKLESWGGFEKKFVLKTVGSLAMPMSIPVYLTATIGYFNPYAHIQEYKSLDLCNGSVFLAA